MRSISTTSYNQLRRQQKGKKSTFKLAFWSRHWISPFRRAARNRQKLNSVPYNY